VRQKSEIRNPKSEANSKALNFSKAAVRDRFAFSAFHLFGFVSDFGFRVSGFKNKEVR
jgi:hypothetical protein